MWTNGVNIDQGIEVWNETCKLPLTNGEMGKSNEQTEGLKNGQDSDYSRQPFSKRDAEV